MTDPCNRDIFESKIPKYNLVGVHLNELPILRIRTSHRGTRGWWTKWRRSGGSGTTYTSLAETQIRFDSIWHWSKCAPNSLQHEFPASGDDLRRVGGIGLRESSHPRQWCHRWPLQGMGRIMRSVVVYFDSKNYPNNILAYLFYTKLCRLWFVIPPTIRSHEQRAIGMSGSATAPWAFDQMPVFHAKRIAQKERALQHSF